MLSRAKSTEHRVLRQGQSLGWVMAIPLDQAKQTRGSPRRKWDPSLVPSDPLLPRHVPSFKEKTWENVFNEDCNIRMQLWSLKPLLLLLQQRRRRSGPTVSGRVRTEPRPLDPVQASCASPATSASCPCREPSQSTRHHELRIYF